MTKKEFLKYQENFFDKVVQTGKKKQADYTGVDDNPFANFSEVQNCGGATPEQGFLFRMNDKMRRLDSFVRKGVLEVEGETMEDACLDLAGYASLFAAWVETQKESK